MTPVFTNLPVVFGLFICLSLIFQVAAQTEWVVGIGALNTPNLEHVCGGVTFETECGSAADKPCNALVRGWSPDACGDSCVLKLNIKPRENIDSLAFSVHELFVRPIGSIPETVRERQYMSPELKVGDNVRRRKLDVLLEPKASMIFCQQPCMCMWSRCSRLQSPNNMVTCPAAFQAANCPTAHGAVFGEINFDEVDWTKCSADDEYLDLDCPFQVRRLADFAFDGSLLEVVNCPFALKIFDEEKSKKHKIMGESTCSGRQGLTDEGFFHCGQKDNPCPIYATNVACRTCLVLTIEIPGCDIWRRSKYCLPIMIKIHAVVDGPILNEDINMNAMYALPWESLEGNIIRHAMMTNDSALEDNTIQRTAKHFSKACTAKNSKMYLKGRDQAYEDVDDCVVEMRFGNDYERAKMIAKKFQNQEFFGVNVEACPTP